MEEVLVRKDSTFCKPDLLTRAGKEILVMDVCVAAPHLLELSWRLKKEKYDIDEVRSTAKQFLGAKLPVLHLPVILSNRGHLYAPTGDGLRKLGLSVMDLCDLCSRAISGSLKVYDIYTKCLNK